MFSSMLFFGIFFSNFAGNFRVERVLCWMLALYWHFGEEKKIMLLTKIVFFSWGKYCARCCVFLYQGCFCCLPPACPSPLHLLRGECKTKKRQRLLFKITFSQKKLCLKTSVDNIIFIESHISYWLPRSSCEPRPPSQYRKSGDMRKITKILKITSYSE